MGFITFSVSAEPEDLVKFIKEMDKLESSMSVIRAQEDHIHTCPCNCKDERVADYRAVKPENIPVMEYKGL